MDIKHEKSKLRKSLLENSCQFSRGSDIEEELHSQIKKNIKFKPGQIIAGYYPINQEIDVTHILRSMATHHTIALPVTVGRSLIFRVWDPFEAPESTNQFDIPEPDKDAEEVLPDVMIVPCVGLSSNGHRIGYGYGYYDKTINQLRSDGHKFLTIGVGYSYQLISSMPYNGLDAQLDWIITNKHAFNCQKSAIPVD